MKNWTHFLLLPIILINLNSYNYPLFWKFSKNLDYTVQLLPKAAMRMITAGQLISRRIIPSSVLNYSGQQV